MVTAAHCCELYQNKPEDIKVIIGDHSLRDPNDGQQIFKTVSVNIHPGYIKETAANDICILKTENMNLS